MSQITSLYVFKVAEQASEGVETHDLIQGLGLQPEGPIDPAQMVSSKDYYSFFEALADRDPSGLALPLRIGAAMRSDDYGAFGLAWKSAPDLHGSYVRSERYGRVLGNAETYSLDKDQKGMFFSLHKAGNGSAGMILSNEASLSAVVALSKEVSTKSFVPEAVYFKHTARGDTSLFAEHFGCPVHFDSGRDAVLISETSLAASNRLGDETIAKFFDRHLEQELAARANDDNLEKRVQLAVAQVLSEGVPTLSFIASALGMSARTLQRRLSDQEQTFQKLVDIARQDLARKLIRETNYSLAEIAFLTGFSEQSGFARAFKRWSGQTPRSYRMAAIAN